MKKLLLLMFVFANYANAQCNINVTEDFSTTNGWTQLGTGAASITNGQFLLAEAYSEWDERAYKSLPCTLTGFPWRLDFDFNPIDLHNGVGPNGYVALTANSSDGMCLPGYGANNPSWTQNTMLRVTYDASYGVGGSQCYFNTIWRKNIPQDYSNRFIGNPTPVGSGTTTYYPRLERLDATHCRMSVFTNAARTTHSAGSPYCFTIDAEIDGFNYIQVGANNEGIGSRVMSAKIDNIRLQNNITISNSTFLAAPTASPAAICGNSSTTLNAYQSGYTSYNWSNGSTSYNTIAQQAGTYTVTVTSASGCVGTGSVTIAQGILPRPGIVGLDILCGSTTSLLTASDGTAAPPNSSTYRWSNGSNGASINAAAGVHTVTVTNSSGCTATLSRTVTQGTPPPAPYFSVQGNTVAVANPQAGATYQWYLNNTALQNETNEAYTINSSGVYSVCTILGNGCQTCSAPLQLAFLATSAKHTIPLVISPNPTNSISRISGLPTQKHQISVVNALGQSLLSVENANTEYNLDLSNFVSGVYFLQIQNEVWRIVKN